MTVIPPEAERHVYANSSDRVVNAPLSSKLWVQLQPGEQVTYWTSIGKGAGRRRRTRRRITLIVGLVVLAIVVIAGAVGAAMLYVQSQLG